MVAEAVVVSALAALVGMALIKPALITAWRRLVRLWKGRDDDPGFWGEW
jgi:hypothetical protein